MQIFHILEFRIEAAVIAGTLSRSNYLSIQKIILYITRIRTTEIE